MLKSLLLLLCLPVLSFAQTGQCASVTGPLLPNLVSYATVSKQTMFVSTETFDAESCPVQEGTVPAGTSKLLRFAARIGNEGEADLMLGDPRNCPTIYEFDLCHGHHHMTSATVYRLWTLTGWQNWIAQRDLSKPMSDSSNQVLLDNAEATGELVRSRKQGFCFKDTVRLKGTPEFTRNEFGVRVLTSHFRHCHDDQGLTVGWGDEYGALLDGQWFIIDTIGSGYYMLEVQANPELILPESNFLDNSSAVKIRL